VIENQLVELRDAQPAVRGMTVALPESQLARLLPSLDLGASTVELDDVLTVLARHLRGWELFAAGNPVLNRVAARSRALDLIAEFTQNVSEPGAEPDDAR
jgi:hypothetical protein